MPGLYADVYHPPRHVLDDDKRFVKIKRELGLPKNTDQMLRVLATRMNVSEITVLRWLEEPERPPAKTEVVRRKKPIGKARWKQPIDDQKRYPLRWTAQRHQFFHRHFQDNARNEDDPSGPQFIGFSDSSSRESTPEAVERRSRLKRRRSRRKPTERTNKH